jgi:pimeloyl-ACP methyl ester carboxylesterase
MTSVRHFKLLILIAALILFMVASPAQQSVAAQKTCQTYTLKVKMDPLNPTRYKLVGEMCWAGDLDSSMVQVLVHGATYNRYYWDFQAYQPDTYSYVDAAIDQGYVTFNIDRLGSGSSAKPDGLLNTFESATYTLHQVVQALRNGTFGGTSFDQVVLVGHSLGTTLAIAEAKTYDDVDGLILTGFTHSLNPLGLPTAVNFFYPTQLDPKFGLLGPLNYLTTMPNSRDDMFYNTANADPAVIALDEQLKDVLSVGQTTFPVHVTSFESLHIDVPVFALVGSEDDLFCGILVDCSSAASLYAFESTFYAPEACLQADVVEGAGHDINLHLNAQDAYGRMLDWLAGFEAGTVCD